METKNNDRIGELDFLRTVALFGMVLMHTVTGYGIGIVNTNSEFEEKLLWFLYQFIQNKFDSVFVILFGISFSLILKKPSVTSGDFVKRCSILILLGLFMKLFYTFDALLCLGTCGIVLLLFRNMSNKHLFFLAVFFTFCFGLLFPFHIGEHLFGEAVTERYGSDKSFLDVLLYKYAIIDYMRIQFDGVIFKVFSCFLFGLWVEKSGLLLRLKELKWKTVIYLFIIYIIIKIGSTLYPAKIVVVWANMFYMFAFSCLFIKMYRYKPLKAIMSLSEPCGRCCLTTYVFMDIFGVISMNSFGMGLYYKYSLIELLIMFTILYLDVMLFCYFWLKKYRYGPLEYLWRCATSGKWLSNTIS